MPTAQDFNKRFNNRLPGLIGMEIVTVAHKRLVGRLEIKPHHLAPNDYLHGGTVVTLADTVCGCATLAHLPEGAKSFTTIELKCNFVSTARDGFLLCEANAQHTGKRTQVWDAVIKHAESDRTIAIFRCTQMILF